MGAAVVTDGFIGMGRIFKQRFELFTKPIQLYKSTIWYLVSGLQVQKGVLTTALTLPRFNGPKSAKKCSYTCISRHGRESSQRRERSNPKHMQLISIDITYELVIGAKVYDTVVTIGWRVGTSKHYSICTCECESEHNVFDHY